MELSTMNDMCGIDLMPPSALIRFIRRAVLGRCPRLLHLAPLALKTSYLFLGILRRLLLPRLSLRPQVWKQNHIAD